jgi:hypothetical protein
MAAIYITRTRVEPVEPAEIAKFFLPYSSTLSGIQSIVAVNGVHDVPFSGRRPPPLRASSWLEQRCDQRIFFPPSLTKHLSFQIVVVEVGV